MFLYTSSLYRDIAKMFRYITAPSRTSPRCSPWAEGGDKPEAPKDLEVAQNGPTRTAYIRCSSAPSGAPQCSRSSRRSTT